MTDTGTALDVVTAHGAVRGRPHPGGAAFRGIPYAAAPVGDLRFAAPIPPPAWDGVRDAGRYGPTPQRRPIDDTTIIPEPSIPGEDTLSVNVFTPAAGLPDAGLPVLVWVHGGGFFAGSPASPWYDGRAFARDGVVVVTLSYRLGFDGFGWIEDAPLNRGILDQIAALEWVRDNIAAFGGDPDRVTIAGQSAGGCSVLTLLTSPRARGLFARAISESGPIGGVSVEDAETAGRALAARLGIEPTLAGWRSVPEERVLDEERDANSIAGALGFDSPAAEIVARMRSGAGLSLELAFSPVADGDVVAADLLGALRGGDAAGVPLLLGATRDEFAYPSPETEDAVLAALAAAGVSAVDAAGYRADVLALGAPFAGSRLAISQLFRLPVVRIAEARVAGGAGDATWLYDFAWRSPVTGNAAHCFEIPFVWDLLEAEGVTVQFGPQPPVALAERMHADWVRFVVSGDLAWEPASRAGAGAERYAVESGFDPEAYRFERALAS